MIHFDALKNRLHSNIINYLHKWLPGGNTVAGEYVVKNPMRSDKSIGSFKINLRSGEWSDFATNDRGRDLISLYGYLNGLRNADAARELMLKL